MRLIELIATDPSRHVALHPRLTVVGGIGPSSVIAADLRAAFGGAADVTTGALVDLGDGTRRNLAELGIDVAQPVLSRADVPRPEPPAPAARPKPLPAPPPPVVAYDEGLGPIDARRAEILALLSRRVPDATPVSTALQALRVATVGAERSREQRASLADAWTDVMTRLSLCPPVIAPSAEVLGQAREAVASAQVVLQRAERDAGASPSADLAELDRVHALVDAAEARAARPLAGAGARRELAAARERERAILDGLGFLSYMDRHLTEALFRPDVSAVDRCDQARAALLDADAVLAELEVMAEEANRRERLEAEAAGYAGAAGRYLGGLAPTDLAAALRTAPDQAMEAARVQLRAALGRAGIGEDDEPAESADRFLAYAAAVAAEHDGLRRELDTLESERARAAERIAVAAAAPVGPVDEGADAEGEIAVGYDEGKELEILLLSHLAGHRGSGDRGSVPLVLDDVFAGSSDDAAFGGLLLLERLADSVQVLYLTDDPRIHRWTAGLGGDRAVSHVTGWAPVPVATPSAPPTPTIAAGIELAERASVQPLESPPPAAPATPKRTQCQVCRSGIATAVCDRCALHLCDDHLLRTPARRGPGRTLCLQCGLVAAGVRRERR